MSGSLLSALWSLYREEGGSRGIPIPAPPVDPSAAGSQDAVAAAIDRQTDVLRELVSVIRALGAGQEAMAEGIGELLGTVAASRTPADSQAVGVR